MTDPNTPPASAILLDGHTPKAIGEALRRHADYQAKSGKTLQELSGISVPTILKCFGGEGAPQNFHNISKALGFAGCAQVVKAKKYVDDALTYTGPVKEIYRAFLDRYRLKGSDMEAVIGGRLHQQLISGTPPEGCEAKILYGCGYDSMADFMTAAGLKSEPTSAKPDFFPADQKRQRNARAIKFTILRTAPAAQTIESAGPALDFKAAGKALALCAEYMEISLTTQKAGLFKRSGLSSRTHDTILNGTDLIANHYDLLARFLGFADCADAIKASEYIESALKHFELLKPVLEGYMKKHNFAERQLARVVSSPVGASSRASRIIKDAQDRKDASYMLRHMGLWNMQELINAAGMQNIYTAEAPKGLTSEIFPAAETTFRETAAERLEDNIAASLPGRLRQLKRAGRIQNSPGQSI